MIGINLKLKTMEKFKVKLNEPFEVKIMVSDTEFLKQKLTITNLRSVVLNPKFGKSYSRMEAVIEHGDSMYLVKTG